MLQARKYGVVGFGNSAVDDMVQLEGFPEPDSKQRITSIERQPGGQCTTALVAASRLGERCAYAGVLGENELSEFVRSALRKEAVEFCGTVAYSDARPYYSIVLVDASTGNRTILYSATQVRGPVPEDISEELIRDAAVLLVDQLGPEGTLYACEVAKRCATQIVADFERLDHECLWQAMRLVDHLILPMRTAREITGCSDPSLAVRELARTGRICTAATDGPNGCWFITCDCETIKHQPAFQVDVVDTTGCGDVFHGAYAAAIARNLAPELAVRYAAVTAALSATQRGGQAGIPSLKAVEQFMADPKK
jgi:ribokinase